MSLRGRYLIDRVKHAVAHRFSLPCPPYGMPTYWEGVYDKLGPDDVYEWGSISLENVLKHRYDANLYADEVRKFGYGQPSAAATIIRGATEDAEGTEQPQYIDTTFGESIGVHPEDSADKKILLLGCGNSKFGEDMLTSGGWSGPIIQADVSQRVVMTMTERCNEFVANGSMDIVQDDATSLTAFEDGTIHAVVDKGLTDALFCASRPDQLMEIMKSVNRVLVPGGIYIFFSFSRPGFLLEQVLGGSEKEGPDIVGKKKRRSNNMSKRMWEDAQVRALDTILMYRFVKRADEEDGSGGENRTMKIERQKRQRMQRRMNQQWK